jgi:cyanuric acid amidohydrolase
VALGEIDAAAAQGVAIGVDTGIWSGRASTSAGVELRGHEILVLGMSDRWTGPLAIDHTVMADGIDTAPVQAAMQRLGIGTTSRLTALLAKTEAGTTGTIRGARHTMLDDSDISATRHARAFTGGALAGLTGRTDLFISGGAEHQGPDGGGPVALIAEREAAQ